MQKLLKPFWTTIERASVTTSAIVDVLEAAIALDTLAELDEALEDIRKEEAVHEAEVEDFA